MTDLRRFLDRLRQTRARDLLEVSRPVDPNFETAAILTKLEEHGRSPVLHFTNVVGTQFPVVTNVCGSVGRLAMALECRLGDVSAEYGRRASRPIPPAVVDDGPCREHVVRGEAVDLHRFPALTYHVDDAKEPYISGAVVVARHPTTGRSNLSYHRLMIAGRNRAAIYIEPGRHLGGILAAYAAAGRDMPVAAFIGCHPLWSLGALYSGSADDEEYAVIGALMKEALPVVHGLVDPEVKVPARAEIVLEGHVSRTETTREGPFGEFTGYGTGASPAPVFTVEALSHRTDPLFQDIVSGRMEHLVLSVPALEHRALADARAAAPGVKRVALVAPLTFVVSVLKADEGEPERIVDALHRDIYGKHVIVVDDDIDPFDLRAVLRAVAMNTQADADVLIRPGLLGTPLDPSCPTDAGTTTKMGIDATRPLRRARTITRNRLPADVLDAIDVRALLRKR